MRAFLITAVVAALQLGAVAPAVAQEMPEVPDINPEDVSVGQVVSYVNARIAVERVRVAYTDKIEAAETEDQIKELIAEADMAAMAAVDKVTGISPGEYLAISIAAQDDAELLERINERISTLRTKQTLTVKGAEKPEG